MLKHKVLRKTVTNPQLQWVKKVKNNFWCKISKMSSKCHIVLLSCIITYFLHVDNWLRQWGAFFVLNYKTDLQEWSPSSILPGNACTFKKNEKQKFKRTHEIMMVIMKILYQALSSLFCGQTRFMFIALRGLSIKLLLWNNIILFILQFKKVKDISKICNSELNITSKQVTPSISQFFPMVSKLMTLVLATSNEFTQIIQKYLVFTHALCWSCSHKSSNLATGLCKNLYISKKQVM